MADIKDIKELRRKRNSKRAIKRAVIFAVLALVIIGAVYFKETVAKENLTSAISDFFSIFGKGDGFPVSVPGSRTVSTLSMDKGAAVLTQTQIMVYSSSGKETLSELHGFSNPLMARNGNKLLVYDRGGKGIKVYSRTKLVFSKTFEEQIYAAEMSDDYIAVVTASQTHSCEVTVLTTSYKEVMKWYCAEGRVTSVVFDDFRSKMFAAVADAKNGSFISTVYKIDIKDEVEELSKDIEGVLAVTAKKRGSGIAVIGQDRTVFLSSELAVQSEFLYNGETLSAFWYDHESERLAVSLSGSENDHSSKIYILSSSGEVSATVDAGGEVECLSYKKNTVAFISDGRLGICETKSGEVKYEETEIDTFGVSIGKDGIYTLGVTKIYKTEY